MSIIHQNDWKLIFKPYGDVFCSSKQACIDRINELDQKHKLGLGSSYSGKVASKLAQYDEFDDDWFTLRRRV